MASHEVHAQGSLGRSRGSSLPEAVSSNKVSLPRELLRKEV